MSETARERFHRVQRETAGEEGSGTAAPACRVDEQLKVNVAGFLADETAAAERKALAARGPRDAADIHAGLRRAAVAKRLTALGLPVTVGEVSSEPAELENLERMCVEFERGQSK